MFAQTSSIAVPVNGQQELVLQLQREDLESCPLGTIGNLQFNAEQGGTAPAPRAGAPLSEMNQPLADRRADLNPDVTGESSQARAQREALTEARAEVRANSLLIGNLLGSLTAKVDEEGRFVDADDRSRFVRALIALNESGGEGGLYSLKGAKYCLHTYLEELKEVDLVALSQGGLSHALAVSDILTEIRTPPDDTVRRQAYRLLRDITEALNQRMLRLGVHEPLSKILDLLAADPVDEQDLCAQLLVLTEDRRMIARYLSDLTTYGFKTLLDVLKKLHAIQGALQHKGLHSEASRLDLLIEAIDDEFSYRRAPRSLSDGVYNLSLALFTGHGPAVSVALHRLSLAVSHTYQAGGALPRGSVERVQLLVEGSMDLFRDHRNNPTGPLNWRSLSRLDEGMRKNLGDAAEVLWAFGLELDPQLRVS